MCTALNSYVDLLCSEVLSALISPFMVSLAKGREVRRSLTEIYKPTGSSTSGLECSFLFLSKFCCLGLVNLGLKTEIIRRKRHP